MIITMIEVKFKNFEQRRFHVFLAVAEAWILSEGF